MPLKDAKIDLFDEPTYETLDAMFRAALPPDPGELSGFYHGKFLAWAPMPLPRYLLLKMKRWWHFDRRGWQGKEFSPVDSLGINMFPDLHRSFPFAVEEAIAYSDLRPCVRLNYGAFVSPMSFIRDDVRRIIPGWYLGRMYLQPTRSPGTEIGFFRLWKA